MGVFWVGFSATLPHSKQTHLQAGPRNTKVALACGLCHAVLNIVSVKRLQATEASYLARDEWLVNASESIRRL